MIHALVEVVKNIKNVVDKHFCVQFRSFYCITNRVEQTVEKPRFFVKVGISTANDRAAAHPETMSRIYLQIYDWSYNQ